MARSMYVVCPFCYICGMIEYKRNHAAVFIEERECYYENIKNRLVTDSSL